ncbi:terminase-like family protein [mine drainage metagenome]|uniref:Terminase-like family protein n=1 Tax=mine drainage metagenome TaxID=410659 RepID=A0A1J5S3E6_9ZZZZ
MTALDTLQRWRKDGPAVFAREVLGATPFDWQYQAGEYLALDRKLSVRSGHGVGKSAFLAWCILWFQSTHFPAKVPCTAPTSHQLSDILWAELAKWHRAMNERMPELGNEFEWSAEKFFLKSHPNESFAVARTSRPEKPEALQGFHSENILFLIDEASAVSDAVFEVAEGALSTDGAYVVMAANPTRSSGYFYHSHHKSRGDWATLQVSGEECENVSREYIDSMRRKYGVSSPIYRVRVLGEFAGDVDTVIPLELCECARDRDVSQTPGPVIWGVDVARFGDDSTALAKRRGNTLLEPIKEWFGKDTMQTAGLIKLAYDHEEQKPACINIDVIGIGAGVVDRLKEQGLPVNGINVAESASISSDKEGRSYSRLRDELWFLGREWLEARDCKLPDDDDLIAELTTPKYQVLSNGTIKVESKDEMKRRSIKSPNRADAFLMTFAPAKGLAKKAKPVRAPVWGTLDREIGL